MHDPNAALSAQDDRGGYSEYFLGNSQSRYAGDQHGEQGAIVEGGAYAGQGIFGVQGDLSSTRPAGVNWAAPCGAGHSLSVCNFQNAPPFSRNPAFDYTAGIPHVGTAPWLNTMMHTFCAEMMNFVFKTRNCVFKTRNCVSKTRNCLFKMMNFADNSQSTSRNEYAGNPHQNCQGSS